MSTRRWIWLISLPNQSKVQHFELSGICSSMIVLRYANKGGSIFWSTISKVCFVVKYTFKGGNRQQMKFTSNPSRDIPYQLTHLESSIAHGGASNPNCSWRRFRYQSNQEWSPYGGDFNFILFLLSYISYVVLKVCPVFDHWWHSRDASTELSFTDQLRDIMCVGLLISHIPRLSCLSVDQLRDMCSRYPSGMDGLQCLPKYTHEVRGGERE